MKCMDCPPKCVGQIAEHFNPVVKNSYRNLEIIMAIQDI
jgi:hypothetical protein